MLVGLHGKRYSGKSEAARILIEHYMFSEICFADPVRDGLAAAFGIPHNVMLDPKLKHIPLCDLGILPIALSYRELVNKFGTDFGRNQIHPDIWVMRNDVIYRELRNETDLIVAGDVRFENEAAWVRGNGGTIIHLEGNHPPEGVVQASNDESEAGIAIAPEDKHIDNSGSISDLENILLETLYQIQGIIAAEV